jgi:hypothetical protein
LRKASEHGVSNDYRVSENQLSQMAARREIMIAAAKGSNNINISVTSENPGRALVCRDET